MKSSDIFDMMGQTNESYKKFIGMDKAQSAHDNASPEDYGYSEIPETPDEEVEAFKAYKFAMELAIKVLTQQMELFRKYNKNDTADLLENDIEELVTEIARRESKIV